ncbi:MULTISPECIES: kynureninase [unclassified Haladaptatus]|uniref:kynureninase n=1 Tax=unclassified Haladaptatus TaxID=2622732 RepID=UPI00209C107E|nr:MULTISPECIES: kynureninase [unclassified Haladaptatus]MCO8244225.1 kynureninase [Haladaptatus sp. AB643]MCO8256029.1 kynureninase [Haladaptatus sp. AB618]
MDTGADDARRRDDADPLSHLRERFVVPDGELYMDGNSLGVFSTDAEGALSNVIEEWRELGIRGWTDADPDWFHYGERLGDRLAPLVGADEREVVVGNSTTVNIHALFSTFYDGGEVVVNELDFPTDHYAIRARMANLGLDPDGHLVVVESRDGRTIEEEDVIDALSDETSILFMPSVLYRSGQLFDIERLTAAAHDHDALAGFDLAHSVGAVPHRLSDWDVDFAVWCSYKYLNAGPGAVAGLYVNERHFGTEPGLAGWWGHDKETQFEMETTFTPADDAGAWQIGTIPVFSAAPLWGSLEPFEAVGIDAVREKSLALTEYLIELVDDLPEYEVGTPRDPERRGGHVAVEHEEAYRIGEALKERGVVVDFRPPNVIRICPAPLYVRFRDVWRVNEHLHEIVETGEYESFDRRSGGIT